MAALWILAASFTFSLMGAAVKLAAGSYSVADIVFYRGLIGLVILFLFVRHQGGQLLRGAALLLFIGVSGVVAQMALILASSAAATSYNSVTDKRAAAAGN